MKRKNITRGPYKVDSDGAFGYLLIDLRQFLRYTFMYIVCEKVYY